MRPPGYDDERPAMADDRRLRDLQRELRAVGLGALVLLGFLGSISLKSRFAGMSDVQRGMYLTSVVLTALAAVLLLAPAAYVRLAHGRRPAEQVAGKPARPASATHDQRRRSSSPPPVRLRERDTPPSYRYHTP
jgi:hypothetical protein